MASEEVRAGLVEADVDPDPVVQFGRWFDDASAARGLAASSAALRLSKLV